MASEIESIFIEQIAKYNKFLAKRFGLSESVHNDAWRTFIGFSGISEDDVTPSQVMDSPTIFDDRIFRLKFENLIDELK